MLRVNVTNVISLSMIVPGAATKVVANSSKIGTLLRAVGDEIHEISSAFGEICRRIKENRNNELQNENEKLHKQIEALTRELRALRTSKGILSVSSSTVSASETSTAATAAPTVGVSQSNSTTGESRKPQEQMVNETMVKSKQNSTKGKKPANVGEPPAKESEPHIGRLDIRVGKIIDVEKHPNADTLYVEKVDIGEEKPRTIISGLVNIMPIEQMRNRTALFLVNLKPVKMRGIESEGMIMCGSVDGKTEILVPPEGVVPGDFVTVEGYERKPDAQLNPKKKIFELVQVDLKTNERRQVTYKGIPWTVGDKGFVMSSTLTNATIG